MLVKNICLASIGLWITRMDPDHQKRKRDQHLPVVKKLQSFTSWR